MDRAQEEYATVAKDVKKSLLFKRLVRAPRTLHIYNDRIG